MVGLVRKLGIQAVFCLFHSISATYFAVIGPSTPQAWKDLISEQITLAEAMQTAESRQIDLLLDASYEEQAASALSSLCRELHIPLLVLGPTATVLERDWTYYMGGVHDQLAAAVDATLKCLDFGTANLIGDSQSYSSHLRAALHSRNSTVVYSDMIISNTDSLDALVAKVLRPKGNRVTLFTTSPGLTKKLLKLQFYMHIGGAGYANILPAYSALFPLYDTDTEDNLRNGNLIVAETAEISVNTEEESIAQTYALIRPYLTLTSTEAKALLDLNFPTHLRSPLGDYRLLNLQNAGKVEIGTISDTGCFPTSQLIFLGNSSSVSMSMAAPIQISGSFGQWDPVFTFVTSDLASIASIVAISEINAQSVLLPNFHLDLWNFTGGVISFDASRFERDVMPHREKFGSAIIANVGSENTMQMITYLRKHGVVTPMVGPATPDTALSSQTHYPNFIRLCLSDDYLNIVIVQTIKRLGWNKCALLVVDLYLGLQARIAFSQLLPSSGIEIVNDPADQVISSSVKNLDEARANFTTAFQHIIDTRCRVVVVISAMVSSYIPVVFYELGMRRGDLIIFGRDWITPYTFTTRAEINIEQVAEVMYGSLQLSPDFYRGQVGSTFRQKYYELTNLSPSSFPCLYYDAAYTIAHALSWLLQSGKDFFNASDMTKALRSVRFIGCTGLVYFEANTNDRQPMRYTLDTLRYNASTGLYIQKLGVYDPAGMVLLTIDESFEWSDGTTEVPSNFRESSHGCPFEDRMQQPFEEGRHLLIGVGLAFALLAAGVGVLVWWHYRAPLQPLTAESNVESDDVLVMLTTSIDLMQALALCASSCFAPLDKILPIIVGDFSLVRNLSNGGFQSIWLVATGLVASFWTFTAWLNCSICRLGDGVSHTLLDLWTYIVANWLFVPIVLTLLNSFDCTEGVADIGEKASFSNSYLAADCYLTCWSERHAVVSSLSAATLLLYLPTAVLYRPIWQTSRNFLNIRTQVTFLSFTPAFQVLLVALYVSFRKAQPVLHSILGLVLWTCRLVSCAMRATHGYARLRVRFLYGASIVLWCSLMALCRLTIPQSEFILAFLLFGISAVLLATGEAYIFLKAPNLLRRPKGIDTFHLFKFAFKPATNDILRNLQREFEKSGSRCTVKNYYLSEDHGSEGRELAAGSLGNKLSLVT